MLLWLLAPHAAAEDLAVADQTRQHFQNRAVRRLVGEGERRRAPQGRRHAVRRGRGHLAEVLQLEAGSPCDRHTNLLERRLVVVARSAIRAAGAPHDPARDPALARIPVLGGVQAERVLDPHRDPARDAEPRLLDELGLQAPPAVVDGTRLSDEDHLRHLQEIAHIPDPVLVLVGLLGVEIDGAVVARVPQAVAVEIELIRVRRLRAVVAGVPHPIAVRVGLVGIGDRRTVVAAVAEPIPVVVHERALTRPALADIARRALVAVIARRVVGLREIGRAGVARPAAALRRVTRIHGRAADVRPLGIGRARGARSVAVLRLVADARRRPTLCPGGLQGTRGGAAGARGPVRGALVALLPAFDDAVAAHADRARGARARGARRAAGAARTARAGGAARARARRGRRGGARGARRGGSAARRGRRRRGRALRSRGGGGRGGGRRRGDRGGAEHASSLLGPVVGVVARPAGPDLRGFIGDADAAIL